MCTRLTLLLLSLSLLVVAGAARADLVGHWTLDEGSGTIAHDSSGFGNDGTIVNEPTWITGVVGGALEFHGVPSSPQSGEYIDCGSDASLDVRNQISIALWIRPDADDPEGKGTSGGETAPLCKAMNPDWNWQVRYGWGGGPTPFMSFTFNTSPRAWAGVGKKLERFEWCHIACSYNGATLTCYLNGEETESTSMGAIGGGNMPILIASDGWRDDWLGAIDDVRIYNEALSEGEIYGAMSAEPLLSAYAPSPKDGTVLGQTKTTLTWQPGDMAAAHEVYFGEDSDKVAAGTPDDTDVFVGRITKAELAVGSAGGPCPTGLVPGTTYYWRVDEVDDANPDSPWKGNVWSFQVQPMTAWKPYPPDGMKYVDPNQDLSWEKGMGAIFHTIFLGQSYEEVDTAIASPWMTSTQVFDPDTLELNKTYYWRVDEFAYPGNVTSKGKVWSFTTRGEGGGGKAEYFSGMALAGAPVLTQIEPSINHNWADEVAAGLSDNVSARWTANLEAPFTETYRLIATSDDGVRVWLDGRLIINSWKDQGTTDCAAEVGLIAGQVYSIRMEWYENTGGAVAQLSWQSPSLPRQIIPQGWLQLPLKATSPYPANTAVDTPQALMLRWAAGDQATEHEIYFGDDEEAVAGATTPVASQGVDELTYNPGALEWGKTYYWRVDEVNAAEGESPWKGIVWGFTTADFLVIDDFESYTDDVGSRIFQTWLDGFGYTEPTVVEGNGTGATVGYLDPPFAEMKIVHTGYLSMPMDYNNANAPYYSEAERTWASPQDWTVNGVDTLVLHVRGGAANGADRLYVALEDSTSNIAVVSYDDDTAVTSTKWLEWSIPLSRFSEVSPAKIKKMYIGVGNRNNPTPGGAGRLYIDDIRVVRPEP